MKIPQENSDANLHASYEEELVATIRKLNEINQVSKSHANDLIIDFMSTIGKLYLSYYQWNLNKTQSLDKGLQEILKQAVPFFRLYGIKLENFLMGTFEDFNEWDNACIERTNIEAFNAMFHEIVNIDVEDIEDCMQQRKDDVSISSPNLIPPNKPKSHWWWIS